MAKKNNKIARIRKGIKKKKTRLTIAGIKKIARARIQQVKKSAKKSR